MKILKKDLCGLILTHLGDFGWGEQQEQQICVEVVTVIQGEGI